MAIEVKSASLKGVIKWLIMIGGMSNESNNLRMADYDVVTHTHTVCGEFLLLPSVFSHI